MKIVGLEVFGRVFVAYDYALYGYFAIELAKEFFPPTADVRHIMLMGASSGTLVAYGFLDKENEQLIMSEVFSAHHQG